MKKYFIKTFGCKLNKADSREYEKILEKFFSPADKDCADIVLINSCGVIEKTERKIIKEINKLKNAGKYVILTGCLPYITQKDLSSFVDYIIPIRNFSNIENFLKKKYSLKRKKNKSFSLQNSVSVVVSISSGCLGECAYCASKIARGKLESKPQEEVLEEVKNFLKKGYKEIQLTSQDIGIYGKDRGSKDLPELLLKIIDLQGDFKIRIGMGNPKDIKENLPELIKIYENKKIYKYLHLPLQSGENKVLDQMRRKYSVEDFFYIVKNFKDKFKNLLLATDVIVGFPGESKEDFRKTYKVIKKIKPHIINITRYSPRPNTEAEKMKDMPERIKKERSRKIFALSKEIRIKDNKKEKGKIYETLLTEKREGGFIGRTSNYKAVIVNKGKLGKSYNVKITDYKYNYLIGETL